MLLLYQLGCRLRQPRVFKGAGSPAASPIVMPLSFRFRFNDGRAMLGGGYPKQIDPTETCCSVTLTFIARFFPATRGTSFTGDIAIDDIKFVDCSLPRITTCQPGDFRCSRGGCVDKRDRCDFSDDCGDESDEQSADCSKELLQLLEAGSSRVLSPPSPLPTTTRHSGPLHSIPLHPALLHSTSSYSTHSTLLHATLLHPLNSTALCSSQVHSTPLDFSLLIFTPLHSSLRCSALLCSCLV